jgi:hypothetical protein
MVTKDYFMKNLEKFAAMYGGKKMTINPGETEFLTLPVVRKHKVTRIPVLNTDHIFFPYIDLELIIRRNQGRLFSDSYLYKFLLYALFVNPQMLKHFLVNILRRTKHPRAIKISNFFARIFKPTTLIRSAA